MSHADNTATLRYDPAKIAPAIIARRIELLGYQVAAQAFRSLLAFQCY